MYNNVHIFIPGGFPVQELHQLVSPSKPCHPGCEQLQDQPDSVVCVFWTHRNRHHGNYSLKMNFSKGSTEWFYGIHVIAKWLFMIYVLKYMYMRDGYMHNIITTALHMQLTLSLHKILYFNVGLTLPQTVTSYLNVSTLQCKCKPGPLILHKVQGNLKKYSFVWLSDCNDV